MARGEYRCSLVDFMSFRDSKDYYANEVRFTKEKLSTITPTEIVRWLNGKAYGNPEPGPDPPYPICSSFSLEYYKKALSYFMPEKGKAWNEKKQSGNPTRSPLVVNLIIAIKEKESSEDLCLTRDGTVSKSETPKLSTLYENPQTVQALWLEYNHGIGGRVAAKDLPQQLRKTEVYQKRKVVWYKIEELLSMGWTEDAAICYIYENFGGYGATVDTVMKKLLWDREKREEEAIRLLQESTKKRKAMADATDSLAAIPDVADTTAYVKSPFPSEVMSKTHSNEWLEAKTRGERLEEAVNSQNGQRARDSRKNWFAPRPGKQNTITKKAREPGCNQRLEGVMAGWRASCTGVAAAKPGQVTSADAQFSDAD